MIHTQFQFVFIKLDHVFLVKMVISVFYVYIFIKIYLILKKSSSIFNIESGFSYIIVRVCILGIKSKQF